MRKREFKLKHEQKISLNIKAHQQRGIISSVCLIRT